jgi:RHS repeat-associated protein
LFAGEQRDSETELDYLRGRYYDPLVGRFVSANAYEGSLEDPMSLHKYLYTHANPVNFTDPTGLFTTELAATMATSTALSSLGGAVIGGAFTAIAGGSSSDSLIGAGKGALAGGIRRSRYFHLSRLFIQPVNQKPLRL